MARLLTPLPMLAVSLWATQAPGPVDIDAQARAIAGEGSSLQRTQRLVDWIQGSFQWLATDYQDRTVEQIIARKGGNCADLARVLERLLKGAGLRHRWVSELNLHPLTPARQARAEALVKEKGLRYSVFGARHNDHRWLEVQDDASGAWVPADPSIGVVGTGPWVAYRLALVDRPTSKLPPIAEVMADMIAPVAVLARGEGGALEDRSEAYLIDGFDAAYGGRLKALPSWKAWCEGVRHLAPLAAQAFQGKTNLHAHGAALTALSETYASLAKESKAAGLGTLNP